MFNKLKQFKDLRSQAKTMQNALADETVTIEKNGVKIIMNGNMEITLVEINDQLAKESLENAVMKNINEATKKVQKLMATKMQEMGGFPGLG